MNDWAAKRFWTSTTVAEGDDGFEVLLDSRRLRTPAKSALILPTRQMADEVAAEWQAQGERIDPGTMPVTRSANAAIDKVRVQHGEVAEMVVAYGDSDLLCYRADAPVELIQRQAEGWDPLLDWAGDALSARLRPVTGVMHMPQDPEALSALSSQVHALDAFQLTAFHDLVALSGSLVIGFAAIRGHLPPETLWQRSRIDEHWQEEQWGADDEASQQAEQKKQAFLHAERFFKLATNDN